MPLPLKLPFLALCLFLGDFVVNAAAQGTPAIDSRLESSMVVVGEQTALTVWLENITVLDWPDSPKAAPLALKREAQKRFNINGRIREGFRYLVSAFEPGIYSIPSFEIRTSSGILRSRAHILRVFPIADLETQGIKIGSSVTPYLTGVFLEKPTPYLGETQDVEAKLYVSHASPDLLRLSDGNVIQMAKDGLAAWRFTTTAGATGYLDYDGHRFHAYTYRSSINALQEGALTLGPGDADAIFQRRIIRRGGFGTGSLTTKLHFPKVELKVRPLPDGAPPEFQGPWARLQWMSGYSGGKSNLEIRSPLKQL